MQTLNRIFFTTLFIITCCIKLSAQVTFTATVDPAIIGKDETAQLVFLVNNAQQVEQIEAPELKDFIIVSGPNQQSSMQITNGAVKQSVGLSYIIKPKSTGTFTIDEASAKVNGKILHSNKVTLKVNNTSAPGNNKPGNKNNNNNPPPTTNQNYTFISPLTNFPGFDEPVQETDFKDNILKDGENIPEKINRNIFIRAIADKTSSYIGEPITVSYKLYTRLKTDCDVTKSPSFSGFSVVDLAPPGSAVNDEKINGREYNVYLLRKVQLYPLQAGNLVLDELSADNVIHFIKQSFINKQSEGMDDMMNDFATTAIPAEGITDEHVTLSNKPVLITVRDLPKANMPVSFKGAVGNFAITASVEKNKLTTNDAGKLIITISGKGNMVLLNAPQIIWPAGVESFESKTTDTLDKTTVPISGSKVFEYPFTVSKADNYALPPIEFSYFDNVSEAYKTIFTKPLMLSFSEGPARHIVSPIASNNASNILESLLPNYRWVLFISIALLVTAGLLFWINSENTKQKNELAREQQTKEAGKSANEKILAPVNPLTLTAIKLVENDNSEFYSTLNKEVRSFLCGLFNLSAVDINKKRIAEEADKKGIPVNTSIQLQQLMDDIEWQLYTPSVNHNTMQQTFEEANRLMHLLNKQLA